VTDGRTDIRTEFSSLDRVCIVCSAVKLLPFGRQAIATSAAISKIFEGVIAEQFYSVEESYNHQFGSKAKHSTAMCTSVFKQTVDYYRNRGSHVFACFVAFVKAFDL